jgi:AbrB family looped-hinge helix DNA binding protein
MTPVLMKVTRAGQISLPAEIRHRWKVERVLVVDHGDRIEIRPMPGDIWESLKGKYKGLGTTTTDEMRAEDRRQDAEAEERMLRRMGR